MDQQIVLVTGANRGIGLAVVKKFLKLGHHVILSSRNKNDGVAETEKLGKEFPAITYHQLDVTKQKSIDQIFDYIVDRFGRLDVLINNAAINYDSWHSASEADIDDVNQTLDTNLIGPWRMCKKFIPLMKKNEYGRIVNVSSGAGAIEGMKGGTPGYSISKTALNVLTIKLAHELDDTGILINAVCPGWVRTKMGGSEAPRSVEQGAETIVWAGLLPDDGPQGKFFRDKIEIPF